MMRLAPPVRRRGSFVFGECNAARVPGAACLYLGDVHAGPANAAIIRTMQPSLGDVRVARAWMRSGQQALA
jgi:hypothetical protein